MRNKILIALGLLVFLIGNAEALVWSNTTFNNSLTEENLTFTGNENITRWLAVPEDVSYVTNGFLNLSGFRHNHTDDNLVTSSTSGSWINPGRAVDGDRTTEATAVQGGNNYLYENQTYASSFDTNWTFRYGLSNVGGTLNITVDCYNYSSSSFTRLYYRNALGSGTFTQSNSIPAGCLNNSLLQIRGYYYYSNYDIDYYEGMIDYLSYLNNSYLEIDGVHEWNYTGQFNQTNNRTNFFSAISSYLTGCTITGGNCLVPFLFHSDTIGILQYLGMLFNNEGFTENSQTFNNITLGGSIETFEINITLDSERYTVLDANLSYNGTYYTGITTSTANNRVYTRTITTPTVSSETNKSFYWSFRLDDGSTVSTFNSTTYNQTARNFSIDNCASNTHRIENFSLVDEELQTTLSGNIEAAVNIFNLDRSVTISNFSANVISSSLAVCSDEIPTNISVLMDIVVKYSAGGYATEYYNIKNTTIDNSTASQNITLYDLNESDTTPFRVTFTGENFLPVDGALVYLDRQYVDENVFKTVELPLTDPNGQTVLHLVRNDVIYNIRFLDQSGNVLGNFQEITAFCEDSLLQNCQISLAATSAAASDFNYDALTGLAFPSAPTFDSNTSTVSFYFVIPSGISKTVFMNVTRNDAFGNRTICENSLTSTSGTLLCSVNSGISDTTLATVVTVDGQTVLISFIDIGSTTLGSVGYVMWFILTLVLVLALGDSKNGMMIALLLAYVGAITLGLSRGSLLGFGAAGTWVLIITVLALWRINREKVQ